jgi:peptide/nickel transport system permease protein
MLSGAVLTETVFAWPGMGRLMTESAFRRDYPTIMATNFIISLLVILANLITDITYSILDPRVKY